MNRRHPVTLFLVALVVVFGAAPGAQDRPAPPGERAAGLQVILLGTAAGPTILPDRFGICTLVVAGSQRLLFDLGRSALTALPRLDLNPADLTKVFLTHLHSDHVFSLPELFLAPWASLGRQVPLQVWGPKGTRAMMKHLAAAFAFDIHVRRDVDEHHSARGITAVTVDVREGIVHQADGVVVTAFLVDHGPVAPAFGYRIDYRGRSVVLSGDTGPSPSLVRAARGADVLVHELGRWKDDPLLTGPLDELMPGSRQTRRQVRAIAAHHTDAVEAGRIFAQVQPKLAVFSHYNAVPAAVLPLVRRNYAGPVEFGDDLMTIDIGAAVTVRRFAAVPR